MKFYGIADAYGIRSFVLAEVQGELFNVGPDRQKLVEMKLKADASWHRKSLVYMAEIKFSTAKKIEDLLENNELAEALLVLKEEASSIMVLPSKDAEKNWKLIPDPSQDPNN